VNGSSRTSAFCQAIFMVEADRDRPNSSAPAASRGSSAVVYQGPM
jgi:hypothetical protein